jgi:hypothetical protein
MNHFFEKASVLIRQRRVYITDVRGFVDDERGSHVLLKSNEEVMITPREKEILQSALAHVSAILRKEKSNDQPLPRPY